MSRVSKSGKKKPSVQDGEGGFPKGHNLLLKVTFHFSTESISTFLIVYNFLNEVNILDSFRSSTILVKFPFEFLSKYTSFPYNSI